MYDEHEAYLGIPDCSRISGGLLLQAKDKDMNLSLKELTMQT